MDHSFIAKTSCDFKAKKKLDEALALMDQAKDIARKTKEAASFVPCPENFVQVIGFGSFVSGMPSVYLLNCPSVLKICCCSLIEKSDYPLGRYLQVH